jgi:hypothetical protein
VIRDREADLISRPQRRKQIPDLSRNVRRVGDGGGNPGAEGRAVAAAKAVSSNM